MTSAKLEVYAVTESLHRFTRSVLARMDELETALEFYAKVDHWIMTPEKTPSDVERDAGDRAREALKGTWLWEKKTEAKQEADWERLEKGIEL